MAHFLRTEEGKKRIEQYWEEHKNDTECALCKARPLEEFKCWKIIRNRFPYERVAEVHHMIVPLRHVTEEGLAKEEEAEYRKIKAKNLGKYDIIIEAVGNKKSIPEHFHLHLIVGKR